MIPLHDSMVDVQSPQQALRAYSNAKEYPYGILCDACHGESNRQARRTALPRERCASPNPAPPQGPHRGGSGSQPLASHTRYRSPVPTPVRDKSRVGHNPVSTLRNLAWPQCVTFAAPHHGERLRSARPDRLRWRTRGQKTARGDAPRKALTPTGGSNPRRCPRRPSRRRGGRRRGGAHRGRRAPG